MMTRRLVFGLNNARFACSKESGKFGFKIYNGTACRQKSITGFGNNLNMLDVILPWSRETTLHFSRRLT